MLKQAYNIVSDAGLTSFSKPLMKNCRFRVIGAALGLRRVEPVSSPTARLSILIERAIIE